MSEQELVQCTLPGLVAIYEDGSTYDDGGIKRRKQETMPIVGYLKDAKGDLMAAVVGDGGKVVLASSIKGFCGTRWSQKQQVIDIKGGGWPGESLFERMDSMFDGVFGRRR